MKRNNGLACMLGIALGVMMAGCYEYTEYPRPLPPGYAAAYTYYYYPDCEVYYRPEIGTYFWFEAGTWRSGRELPHTIVIRPEASVRINLDSPVPYAHHEEIQREHPGRGHAYGRGRGGDRD